MYTHTDESSFFPRAPPNSPIAGFVQSLRYPSFISPAPPSAMLKDPEITPDPIRRPPQEFTEDTESESNEDAQPFLKRSSSCTF